MPFPFDEALAESELFWALVDVLDVDGWVVHTAKLADLRELAPAKYQHVRGELEAIYPDLPPMVRAGPVTIGLQQSLVENRPSDAFYELLLRRGAALDFRAVATSTAGNQHDVPPYPFTDVLSFSDLLQ